MTRQPDSAANPPSVAIKTIGCRLNTAESAAMAGSFVAAGYVTTRFGEPCDVAVVHGCAITQRAESESLQAIRRAKRAHSGSIVILAGCPGETLPDAIRSRSGADVIVGQAGKLALPIMLHQLFPARFPRPAPNNKTPEPHVETKRAYLKVQDGCDFHCAYCIVPMARGMPCSRPHDEILDDVQRLARAGFQEIVITGANLGCYGIERGTNLPALLKDIDTTPGVGRFRLGSVEVSTVERSVADFMTAASRLCRFLHLPMQSGDDGILSAMGRRYDSAAYQRAAEHALARVPNLGLGTDIMVGFPGEDDRAFANTLKIVRDIPFGNLHVFPFSRRAGTRAASMARQVPETVKKERVRQLLDLAATKRKAFAGSFAGREATLLVEKVEPTGLAWGWTGEYIEAQVPAPDAKVGQLLTFIAAPSAGPCLTGRATGTPSTP